MNNPKARSMKWETHNDEPTMTDQAGAGDTDINLIVKRYGVYGQAPGGASQPLYGDFADMPDNLADAFRLMRSRPELINQLPEQLRGIPLEELITLTDAELAARLTTPAPPPAPTPATPAPGA